MQSDKPVLISGDFFYDDRGQLTCVNEFNPTVEGICRCYLVSNHRVGMIRAWHGHKKEAKYVMVVSGSALIAAVKIDDWNTPNSAAPVHRFVITNGVILYIPPGYANGWMSLTDDARLLFFSTATLAESAADDYRFPARYWDCWKVEER